MDIDQSISVDLIECLIIEDGLMNTTSNIESTAAYVETMIDILCE